MKTLTRIVWVFGLAVNLLAGECDERPRLTQIFYANNEEPGGIPVLFVVWTNMCPFWTMETSSNLVDWQYWPHGRHQICDVTNGYQTNCFWYVIDSLPPARRFYRLRLRAGMGVEQENAEVAERTRARARVEKQKATKVTKL